MNTSLSTLINAVQFADSRITVLPETWKLNQYTKGKVTFETVSGEYALNLKDVQHTMSFELSLATPDTVDSNVLLSYFARFYTADFAPCTLPGVEDTFDPMSMWSPRDLEHCVAWLVRDTLMLTMSIIDDTSDEE